MNFVTAIVDLAPNGASRKGVFTTRVLQDILDKSGTSHQDVVANWPSIESELEKQNVIIFPAPCDVDPAECVRVFKKESRIVSLLDALLFPTPDNNVVVANAVKRLAQHE